LVSFNFLTDRDVTVNDLTEVYVENKHYLRNLLPNVTQLQCYMISDFDDSLIFINDIQNAIAGTAMLARKFCTGTIQSQSSVYITRYQNMIGPKSSW